MYLFALYFYFIVSFNTCKRILNKDQSEYARSISGFLTLSNVYKSGMKFCPVCAQRIC